MSTRKRVLDCSPLKSALKKSSTSESPEVRRGKRVSFSDQASTQPLIGRHDGTKVSVCGLDSVNICGSGDVVPSPVSRTKSMDKKEKSPLLPFLMGSPSNNTRGVQFQPVFNHSSTKSGEGNKKTVLPTYRFHRNGPAKKRAWIGTIEVDNGRMRLPVEMTAHLSAKGSRKAYDFLKKINAKLRFKLLPRGECYRRIFQGLGPNRDDIALYFYPAKVAAKVTAKVDWPKRKYSELLRAMRYKDLMMRSCIDGTELLIFPSSILPADSQVVGGCFFMWGIFRHVKDEI